MDGVHSAGREQQLDGQLALGDGGFTGDTEVMTTGGPCPIKKLTTGTEVYALNPLTKLAKPKELTEKQRLDYTGPLLSIQSRRTDLKVHPDQRIPYTTKYRDTPRIQRAGNLTERREYRLLNEWRAAHGQSMKQIDITDYISEYEICVSTESHGHSFRSALPENCAPCRRNSHIGYLFDPKTFKRFQGDIESIALETTIHGGLNHHRRPYKFSGDDFLELLAWFVAEGSVTRPSSSDTAIVQIAQQDKGHQRTIHALFDRLGINPTADEQRFAFGSVVFGELLESLCGSGSKDKHLPGFVWDLSRAQKQLILDVLLWGDGNDQGTYYTSSEELAGNVLRLCLELGIKPAYRTRDGIWQVYVRSVNDGLDSTRNVGWSEGHDSIYQLGVRDYSHVLAGLNGKFQWIGVSKIS